MITAMNRLLCALAILLLATKAMGAATLSSELNFDAVQPGQQAVIAVVLDVPAGQHAQSHRPHEKNLIPFEVMVATNDKLESFAAIYPIGEDHTYPALGILNVYTDQVVVYVPIQINRNATPGDLKISGLARYQICNDRICFAPQATPFTIDSKIVAAGVATNPNKPELFKNFDPSVFSNLVKPPAATGPTVEIFGHNLDNASWIFIFGAAFLIGIIFNVVPCVLPVVPLKAMGFYEVSQHNRTKCLIFGFVFALGLVASFAVLGLFVVVWRRFAWGEQFSNPWFLGTIVAILAIMALSTFGAFSVGLPQWVYRITPRHDTYSGNFLFGILTAVLSTPCTFGMFLGLMIWATRQPAAAGMSLMIVVGMGMAFPYVMLSAFPETARSFPRTGPWAELVKQMMGFLLLASAVYFARRFIVAGIGDKTFWWVLFAVVAAAGAFLIARSMQFAETRMASLVAIAIAILFVTPSFAVAWRLSNPPIDWKPYSVAALAEARRGATPVIVEFTADWCGNCLALETTVFHDKKTVATFKRQGVVTLRADLSKTDAAGWDLLRKISPVGAIPLTAIYAPGAAEPKQLSGLYSTSDLINAIEASASGPAKL
jgi:thiol:disulfide interchange protein